MKWKVDDWNKNNPGMDNGTTAQIYGVGIPLKEAIVTAKEKSKLLVKETYYRFRTMAKKFLKFGPVESKSMYFQIAPIYYAKYRNKEREDKSETQIRKISLLRFKSVKCHNNCYPYKIKECLELQQEREKLEEQKKRYYTAIFKKREHKC